MSAKRTPALPQARLDADPLPLYVDAAATDTAENRADGPHSGAIREWTHS